MEGKILKRDEQLSLECDCGMHYLTVTYYAPYENEPPAAFLTVMRGDMSLWERIKEAVRIILGKESIWEEFLLDDFNKAKKLKLMAEKIENSLKNWEEVMDKEAKNESKY